VDREQRGVGADADRDGEHGDTRKPRTLAQRAHGLSKVSHKRIRRRRSNDRTQGGTGGREPFPDIHRGSGTVFRTPTTDQKPSRYVAVSAKRFPTPCGWSETVPDPLWKKWSHPEPRRPEAGLAAAWQNVPRRLPCARDSCSSRRWSSG